MNIIEYIRQAEREAMKQHIETDTVLLNNKNAIVRKSALFFSQSERIDVPPMVCGLAAFLTDELPDNIAFAAFNSGKGLSSSEKERIREEARLEMLEELRHMTVGEINHLLFTAEKHHENEDYTV